MSVVELNCGKMFSLNASVGMQGVRQWRCSTLEEATGVLSDVSLYSHVYPFPAEFPVTNGSSCMVVAVEIAPFTQKLPPGSTAGSPATIPAYSEYLVTAHYQRQPTYFTDWPNHLEKPVFDGRQLIALRIRNSGQYLTITSDQGGYYADGVAKAIAQLAPDVSTCVMIPLRTYTITLDRVEQASVPKIRSYVGRVNSLSFLNSDPETILCEAASIDHSFASLNPLDESPVNFYRMTVVLTERRIESGGKIYGWNHEYVNAAQQYGGPGFYRVRLSNHQDPRYPKIDMTNMFTDA